MTTIPIINCLKLPKINIYFYLTRKTNNVFYGTQVKAKQLTTGTDENLKMLGNNTKLKYQSQYLG